MKRTKAAVWAQRVAAWRASGQTAETFSQAKDYRAQNIRWWSYELARREKGKGGPPTLRMARVVRTKALATPAANRSGLMLRVGAVEIPLTAGFDKALLAEVVAALSGAKL